MTRPATDTIFAFRDASGNRREWNETTREWNIVTTKETEKIETVDAGSGDARDTMTGEELIKWAVRQCEEQGIAPTDGALILMIRLQWGKV